MDEKYEANENCNPLLQKPVKIDLSKIILQAQGKKLKGIKLVSLGAKLVLYFLLLL